LSKVSIRQPVVLYAMVFMLIVAFSVVTLASFSMVSASRRAYRRALQIELEALATSVPREVLAQAVAARRQDLEVDIILVTGGRASSGVTIEMARAAAHRPELSSPLVALSVPSGQEEAYLVGRFSSSIPLSIAFVEVSRMVPFVLVGALACAALLAFMIGRLVLPPLSALSEIAEKARIAPDSALEPSDAPNEIVEVARSFKNTVRVLDDERRKIEVQKNELERMQASLIRASKLASVGRLAAGIAHEIGNPLAAVQGYLSLMKAGLDESQRGEVLDRCTRELQRINDTIRKLLTYARTGEDPSEPPVAIDAGKVVEEALALVGGHPVMRGIDVDNAVASAPAIGRAGHLNQVMVNLLLNAAQAMEGRTERRIVLERRDGDGTTTILVSDTGPGIPVEKREQVFDPFYTTKAPGEGTGLGLAISRSLVEGMGGALEIVEPAAGGATFAIRLQTRIASAG
jgi:C4-dicarboxylate-specific signal transduction histidine kinase